MACASVHREIGLAAYIHGQINPLFDVIMARRDRLCRDGLLVLCKDRGDDTVWWRTTAFGQRVGAFIRKPPVPSRRPSGAPSGTYIRQGSYLKWIEDRKRERRAKTQSEGTDKALPAKGDE